MALIKEDGTIVAGANSYADEADADAYQADRGRAAWLEATTEVADAALVRATDYIEGRFGLKFIGARLGDVQTLSWPRKGAVYVATGNPFPQDEVPVDIVNACILYADQVIGDGSDLETMTELSVIPTVSPDGQVKLKKEKVDVLEEVTEYAVGGQSGGTSALRVIQPIPEADRLVRRWLIAGGVGGLTVRI
ncbi:unnamed protein product [marine sediment metagenome]|uniref:Putative DnaT-like domain-containing protein n=1 Tax=marine sediment metagenome TaxID=412755 RepID=X0TYP8_9ZZZZ